MAGLIRANLNEWDTRYERAMNIIGWLLLLFTVFFQMLILIIIKRNRNQIESDEFTEKYGELLDGINPKKSY